MSEVPEPQCRAAQVFEPAVDGFCWAVGSARPVEVGQDVRCPAIEGSTQTDQLMQSARHRSMQ